MIKSWKNSATRQFAETGKSRFPGMDVAKALNRIMILRNVKKLDDIPPLNAYALHKLSGNRKDQWAMTINGRWRMVFEFHDGNVYNVEIVDYH